MTTASLSKRLGLHPVTVTKWAKSGLIPGIRMGGRHGWKFDFKAVEEALRLKRGNKAERKLVMLGRAK